MEQFLRYDQIYVEKLPLVKIRKNKPKSEISASKYQKYTKFTFRYMFCGWRMRCSQLKFLCVSPKTSKSKMAANYG